MQAPTYLLKVADLSLIVAPVAALVVATSSRLCLSPVSQAALPEQLRQTYVLSEGRMR